jgi:hypothetical protein
VGCHNVQEIHDHKKHVDWGQKKSWPSMTCLTHLFVLPWTFLLHRLFTTLERR